MPDHLHGIIAIDAYKENDNKRRLDNFISPTHSLGAIVRGYKGTVTKQIRAYLKDVVDNKSKLPTINNLMPPIELIPLQGSIWQINYYEHIIKNQEEYSRISQYIIDNPKNFKG